MRVCDTTAAGLNWPTFDPELFTTDGVHVAPEGASAIAEVLLPILRGIVSPGAVSSHEPVAGNLWINAKLSGTAVTRTSATATLPTGPVANGHAVRLSAGTSSVVCSKEMGTDGFEKQVFTITPVEDGAANRVHELRLSQAALTSLNGLGVAPGDWLEAYLELELSAWDHWLAASLLFEIQNAAGTYILSVLSGLVNPENATRRLFKRGNAGFSGWLKTCPFEVPVGANRLIWNARPIAISWDKAGSGTGTAKVGRLILRKASDPKPAWNL